MNNAVDQQIDKSCPKGAVPCVISDMFFNMKHDDFDAWIRKLEETDGDTDIDGRELIIDDAEMMSKWLDALGISIDAESLVDDFFARL